MIWLIIGGTGQLGKALSAVLNEREIEFISWGSKHLDIRSAHKTSELISSLKPSIIINAAAWTDVDGAERDINSAYVVNVEGTRNLTLAAKAAGAVFVQISTDYVFSGVGSLPWKEDDVRKPISVYGKTKSAGEDEVLLNYPEGSYIFRTAWIYSQWGGNFAKSMVKLALKDNNDIHVVSDQIGQPTFAIDLANQIATAIAMKIPFGVYHITNSGQATWFDFAQEIFRTIPVDVLRVIPVTSSESKRSAQRPANSVLSNELWNRITLSPMQDWKSALHRALPAIISTVKKEQSKNGF
jgi:dTDP-4-dehydrorhamnose reductase